MAGAARFGRTARAARRGGLDPARAAADAEGRDQFPGPLRAAFGANDVLIAAALDQAFETPRALLTLILVNRHGSIILAEFYPAVHKDGYAYKMRGHIS
jgi:hypothetical protein